MTELEYNEKKQELRDLQNQSYELDKKIRDTKYLLNKYQLEKVIERFKDFKDGDKVIVTSKLWFAENDEDSYQVVGFFNRCRLSLIYSDDPVNNVEIVFHKPKSDGTAGKREFSLKASRIIKMEKFSD